MTQNQSPPLGSQVLARVRDGMAVRDVEGDRVGTVEFVYLGAARERAVDEGAVVTPSLPGLRGNPLNHSIGESLSADRVPEEIRARLLLHGFIRVDSPGLFAADRYVMPEQVASVTADEVRLHVPRAQLVKR